MFKFKLLSIILLFALSFSFLAADQVASDNVIEAAPVINPILTNTDPSLNNIIAKTEEVKSLIDQWKIFVAQVKNGSLSLGLLVFTMLPLLMISLMTIGAILVGLLRMLAFFTSDEIDKKLIIAEDWITKYIIKIPLTMLTRLKNGKKKN